MTKQLAISAKPSSTPGISPATDNAATAVADIPPTPASWPSRCLAQACGANSIAAITAAAAIVSGFFAKYIM